MNEWQKCFIDRFYKGEMPKDKMGLKEYELLGNVKDRVIVHLPGKIVEYDVYADRCDMRHGIISASVLASNLYKWNSKGFKIETAENHSEMSA